MNGNLTPQRLRRRSTIAAVVATTAAGALTVGLVNGVSTSPTAYSTGKTGSGTTGTTSTPSTSTSTSTSTSGSDDSNSSTSNSNSSTSNSGIGNANQNSAPQGGSNGS